MSGQQQQADNSLDFLWMCAIVVAVLAGTWYLAHDYITLGIFYVRLAEITVIEYCLHFAEYLVNLTGTNVNLTAPLQQWKAFIENATLDNVQFNDMIVLSTEVGKYISYPAALIMFILAWWLYTKHIGLRFIQTFDMKRLRSLEVSNWPQITPVVHKDVAEMDINEGKWAMAQTPIQFGLKHDLLIPTTIDSQPRVNAKKGSAHRVFALQLGPLWRGAHRLPIHARALFAAFAAKGNRDGNSCNELLRQIGASASSSRIDYTGTDELLKKHINTKLVKRAVSRHAYVLTVMCSMLDLARTDGVLASADFLWLKEVDRRLWYVLNSVGRQTAVPEAAGPYAHWRAENAFGRPLIVPQVDQAVEAYQTALEGILYDPDD